MKKISLLLAIFLFTVSFSWAQKASLPDLKGRTVIAVTENAYTPLNFVDPKTGKPEGWGI